MAQTPVSIVTGFLGSGKTTLLNRALRDPRLARTAVLINEFGAIGQRQRRAAGKRLRVLRRQGRSGQGAGWPGARGAQGRTAAVRPLRH
jgi:hypothetical protein